MAKLGAMLVLIVSFTKTVIGKSIIGEEPKSIYKTDGKYVFVFGLIVIGVIGFGSLSSLDVLDNNDMKWFWLGFLTLTLSFYSFVEWKFLKGSKEYITSLLALMVGIIFIFIFMF